MTEEPHASDRTDAGVDATGTPRWVKVFAAIAIGLVVLLIVVLITGRGDGHGPSRHLAVTDCGGNAALV